MSLERFLQTILSYGMGVESTAILLRWIFEPETRPCPLNELLVIIAQVGDEYLDTKHLVETYILPLLRQHGIRLVQVARAGHLEADGIRVLEDSTNPTACFIEGAYKLSDELRLNGTVPQYGGVHRCALKFKAFVIERWLTENLRGGGNVKHAIGYNADELSRIENSEYAMAQRQAEARIAFGFNADETDRIEQANEYDGLRDRKPKRKRHTVQERIAFGYNADEQSRIGKNSEYNTFTRTAFYPLMEWGWDRQRCIDYIQEKLGVTWRKSACVYCPFNALRDEAIERHREHPAQVADAMTIEHMSLSLNPRGSLYKGQTLIQITLANGNHEAHGAFQKILSGARWALYRVRRIYYPGKGTRKDGKPKKGTADRCVERVLDFTDHQQAMTALLETATDESLEVVEQHGIRYAYRERKGDTLPAREEFYVAAPATVKSKAAHGIPWFNARWNQHSQTSLFNEEKGHSQ